MKTMLKGTRTSSRSAGLTPAKVTDTVTASAVAKMLDRYGYPEETREIIQSESLLPTGVLSRLQASYPQHSGLLESRPFLFHEREQYSGLEGFREVVKILARNGIQPGPYTGTGAFRGGLSVQGLAAHFEQHQLERL